MSSLRKVQAVAVAIFDPQGIVVATPTGARVFSEGSPGALSVPGFDPIKWGVPRKHIKTMTRAVQLGVAAANAAIEAFPLWKDVPAPRRGMYVGGSPQSGDPEDLAGAMARVAEEGPFTLERFARLGVPQIPPLWLVKGLSNNILGYAAAQWDLQGDNGNWCDGRRSGLVALSNAWFAIAEGRADLALAGGADSLVGGDLILGRPGSEGAAFVVLTPVGLGEGVEIASLDTAEPEVGLEAGELGASVGAIRWSRKLLQKIC